MKALSVQRILHFLVLLLAGFPTVALAQTGYEIDLSSTVNADLTSLSSALPPNAGQLTVNGVPFGLATTGQNADTGYIQTAANSVDSYTIPVNLAGMTTVYALINSEYGACGTNVGEVDFTGASSGTYAYYLTEGENIRDYNQASFCNTTSYAVGSAPFDGGQQRLDVQEFDLPASFANDTLVSVTFQGYGLGGTSGDPFLVGMTAATGSLLTTPLQFIPTTPCRVIDTRGPAGEFGAPELGAGQTNVFDLPDSTNCNIPTTAVAYSLNITVVPDATLSYLTVWPDGQAQPNVSTLNSDGRVKANAAIVPAGNNGGIDFYATDNTQLIVDIDGYFVPAGTASALAFYPVTPCRIADTRQQAGALGGPFLNGGSSRDFPILSSSCGLPSTAQAYSLNVTAVPHSTLNYLTTWPSDQAQPDVSTLNASTGAVTANAAIVPASVTDGDISVFVSDDADVILDVNGYFAPPATNGLSLYTITPCRIIDTRSAGGAFSGILSVDVGSSTCALPSTAEGYVLNATVVPAGPLNYLTLWPDGETQPYVSSLNADDGAVTSNLAIVPVLNENVDAFASNPTNLILDISSYFAP